MVGTKKKHRLTVSITDDDYAELCALAEKSDVSLAWLARQAIADLIEKNRVDELQMPLHFERQIGVDK